ncbi:peptidyl-prolyl isomerase [unidentified eubacterium SCB49]|nr:peptidyl-prolyl isomerase [unidentified eubacterium SCB49]
MHKLFFTLLAITLLHACKSPEARKPVQQNSGTFIDASIERNKKLVEAEEAQIEDLMKSNPAQQYITSDNGFWYFYETKDTLNTSFPKFGDRVQFTYNVSDLDGNVIVSEKENGLQEYFIDQTNQELITGIRQGLKLMKEGEKVTFLFPSHKAYGYYGIIDKIGANVPVTSTVTLKSIDKTQ